MTSILDINLPPDYQFALNSNRLRHSVFKMDRNPENFNTREAFLWALAQDIKAAYKHSLIHKTHWVVVTTFDGDILYSAPGLQELI